MTCKDAIKLIHQVLDGEAPEGALAELNAHTDQCRECAAAWESMSGTEAVLRERETDLPDDAYFDAMARRISAETRQRVAAPGRLVLVPWARSLALAAACLAIGVMTGRAALPKTETVTRVEYVTREVEVPGPVQVKEVVKEVPGPVQYVTREKEVVRWKTRTVYVNQPAEPSPAPPVEAALATPSAATEGGTSRARRMFTSFRAGRGADSSPRLSADEFEALAASLTAGARNIDDTLHAPTLAAALVTGVSTAEAAVTHPSVSAAEAETQPDTQ